MYEREDIAKLVGDELRTMLASYAVDYSYVISYCTRGGKFIRPQLFLEAVELWHGKDDSVLSLAVAIELLHCFFVIHDDIMDDDDLRRESLTVHAYFSEKYGVVKGRALALGFGDALYTRALELFQHYSMEHGIDLLTPVLGIVSVTIQGQIGELQLENIPPVDRLLQFYREKTAMYSLHMPLLLAALVAGRGDVTKIQEFGGHLGVAYQIYDDLIELIGEKRRSHDGRIQDIARLKVTPILLDVLAVVGEKQRITLQQYIYEGTYISEEEEKKILETITKNNLIAKARGLVEREVAAARDLLVDIGLAESKIIASLFQKYLSVE